MKLQTTEGGGHNLAPCGCSSGDMVAQFVQQLPRLMKTLAVKYGMQQVETKIQSSIGISMHSKQHTTWENSLGPVLKHHVLDTKTCTAEFTVL